MSMLDLIQALDNGDMQKVDELLDSNPGDVSMRDGNDRVALHYAAEVADKKTFQKILELDPSLIDCADQNGYTPLLIASMSGNVSALELLVNRGANINHFDKDKHSAVHWAVVCGQLYALMTLLRSNANINARDKQGAQPLHYATVTEDMSPETSIAILHTLLKNGASVNGTDFDGRTPLLWAASNGNVEAIIAFLQAGANQNLVDKNQLDALHCAASQGHEKALHLLVENSELSSIDSVDRNGDTPLFYAVSMGHYECARILLESGANPNHQDNRLKTPSHCAAAKGQLRMLKLLKQFGASIEIQNRRGDIPLHEAIEAGSKDIVEWLLSNQPSTLNGTNHAGRSGLHLAAASGNMEIAVLLCTKNAEIDPLMLSDGKLYTPLDLAEIRGHAVVADYLRQRYNANKATELNEKDRQQWTAYLEKQISRAKELNSRKTIIKVEYNQRNGSSKLTQRRFSLEDIAQEVQEIQTERRCSVPAKPKPSETLSDPISEVLIAEKCLPKATSTTDLQQSTTKNVESLTQAEKVQIVEQQKEDCDHKELEKIIENEQSSQDPSLNEHTTANPMQWQQQEIIHVLQKDVELSAEEFNREIQSKTDHLADRKFSNSDVERLQEKQVVSNNLENKSVEPDYEVNEKSGNDNRRDSHSAYKRRKSETKSDSTRRRKNSDKHESSINEKSSFLKGASKHQTCVEATGSCERESTSSDKIAANDNMHTLSLQSTKNRFFYDCSSAEGSDDNQTTSSNYKKSTRIQKTPYASSHRTARTFEGSSEKRESCRQRVSGYSRLQAQEATIFQELTSLKKTQIQHGKQNEKTAVRMLIKRFCKRHELDPATLNFFTYNDWEKFLHEQLKLLYAEEKQRLLRAKTPPSIKNATRLVTPTNFEVLALQHYCESRTLHNSRNSKNHAFQKSSNKLLNSVNSDDCKSLLKLSN